MDIIKFYFPVFSNNVLVSTLKNTFIHLYFVTNRFQTKEGLKTL